MKISVKFSIAVVLFAAVFATLCALPAHAQKGGGSTPPPNPEIAFSDSGLKVMNADGTNVRTVVSAKGSETANYPCWSSNGAMLAFFGSFSSGGVGLYTVNLDGTGKRRIVPTTSYVMPDWSRQAAPDGIRKIAFTYYGQPGASGAQRDVFIVNPDGTGLLNLTNTPDVSESYCAWTRDGSQLAFTRLAGSLGQAWRELVTITLGLDPGGNLIPVSEDVIWQAPTGIDIVQPRWANGYDGVVFGNTLNGLVRLYVLDLSQVTPTLRLLTAGSDGDERFPSFSSDDSKISFMRGGFAPGIYTVSAGGTGERRVSKSGFAPSWKRAPEEGADRGHQEGLSLQRLGA